MYLVQLAYLLVCLIQSQDLDTGFVDYQGILFSPKINLRNISAMSIANYYQYHKNSREIASLKLLQLLLFLSGNVELNPGPRGPKYPCGECGKAANFNAIACDNCNSWFHRVCAGMSVNTFECYSNSSIEMEWLCIQ